MGMTRDDRAEGQGPAVEVDRDGAVVTLRLNRPQVRNALTDEILELLCANLSRIDEDPATRCVVVAGSDRVFASGADIRTLASRTALELHFGRRAQLWAALRAVKVPLVAAVSGFCLGGGCELAMSCDLIVAAPSARFGLPETRLGLIPGAGGTQMLAQAIGKAKAMDVILSGRMLGAQEAEQAGLVSRVAEQDDWLAVAQALAAEIAARAPLANRLAKEAVLAGLAAGMDAGIQVERRAFAMAFASEDAKEGIASFLERRAPSWQAR